MAGKILSLMSRQDTPETARKRLDGIRAQLDKAEADRAFLVEERRKVAPYAADETDSEAVAALRSVNNDLADLDMRLEDLRAGLDGAQDAIMEADRREQAAADEKQRKAIERAEADRRKAAADASKAMRDFEAAWERVEAADAVVGQAGGRALGFPGLCRMLGYRLNLLIHGVPKSDHTNTARYHQIGELATTAAAYRHSLQIMPDGDMAVALPATFPDPRDAA